jgi:hypothetical protein
MRCQLAILTLMLVGAAVLGGCERHVAAYNRQTLSRETFTVNSPYAVVDTAPLAAAEADRVMLGQGPGGWNYRADGRLAVGAHGPKGEIVTYEIEVRDYQRSTEDRVHDHYNQITRSYRVGQYVR